MKGWLGKLLLWILSHPETITQVVTLVQTVEAAQAQTPQK
jgi:hypothetical protein